MVLNIGAFKGRVWIEQPHQFFLNKFFLHFNVGHSNWIHQILHRFDSIIEYLVRHIWWQKCLTGYSNQVKSGTFLQKYLNQIDSETLVYQMFNVKIEFVKQNNLWDPPNVNSLTFNPTLDFHLLYINFLNIFFKPSLTYLKELFFFIFVY